MFQLQALISGIGFGLSLIVAIGPQNAFVIRQGLLRRHVLAVVAICALSDALLIAIGINGVGAVIESAPAVLDGVRICGVVFLMTYSVFAVRRALKPAMLNPDEQTGHSSVWPAVATAVALTWLNPHVYLDTVVLLGSIANSRGDARWWFGLGAITASLCWFATIGFGARLLRPVFARATAWRVLDVIIAITMTTIAATLIAELVR